MAWHDCGWKGLKTKPGPKPPAVKKDTKTKEGTKQ
jgi:hypothetical protein